MRSWPNLFQTSESVSSQFVCLLVWICTTSASFHLPQTKQWETDSGSVFVRKLLEGKKMFQASVSGSSLQSLMHWTCNCHVFLPGLSRHKHAYVHMSIEKYTHVNLSFFDWGPMFTDLILCPTVLHWGVQVEKLLLHTYLRFKISHTFKHKTPSRTHTRSLANHMIPLHTHTQSHS